MSIHAYLFEAKSIQTYILESGRMRDLIGASEMVDALTSDLLPDALHTLGFQDDGPVRFSRRAGGALYAFANDIEPLERFATLWSLLVQQFSPGLSFDAARGTGSDEAAAFEAARAALLADASRFRPVLPITAPITQRSSRTGQPGVEIDASDQGVIDLPTKRKKSRFSNPARIGLFTRFSPPKTDLRWRDWPRDLTPGVDGGFPFRGDDHTVALIHADGNGLGELLRKAKERASKDPTQYVHLFRELSLAIAQTTERAAQRATQAVLLPEREQRIKDNGGMQDQPLAARPIVLGGDDLTLLVRGDLAIRYLQEFLGAFEEESRRRLPELQIGTDGLTAGAGVVFMRASQPFYLATALAEDLARLAKRQAKAIDTVAPPSAVAFHRVTNSMVERYEEIVLREKTYVHHDTRFVDTLGAYALHQGQGLPALSDLLELQELLAGPLMSRGPTRQLHSLIGLDLTQARSRYRRWQMLMRENQNPTLESFKATLERLGQAQSPRVFGAYTEHPDLPYFTRQDGYVSPLADALTLTSVGSAMPESTATEKEPS